MQKIIGFVFVLNFLMPWAWCQGPMVMQVHRMDSLTCPLGDSLIRNLAGFGVSVFNVKSNLNHRSAAIGRFLNGNPQFPFRKGLVMSTGIIDSIPRANRFSPISSRIQHADTLPGCSEGRWLIQRLLSLQSTNGLTQRATELSTVKFDLVPASDSISFRYVFASEEYPEFVCTQFNDMFGFFIKGPGISGDAAFEGTALEGYQNMARLLGNGFPVAINSVNSGFSGPTGSPANCRISEEGILQYRANESVQHPLYQSLAFDGLTAVLHAKAAVLPCQVYSIVLVVSDVGDRIYDSGVFIESGSLTSGKPAIELRAALPGLKDTAGACFPISIRFSRCANIQETWSVPFKVSGTAVEGIHFRRVSAGGGPTALGQAMVLSAQQNSDSLVLEAMGNSLETRYLVLNYLDPFQPYLGNQPNYIRKADTVYFKGRWRKPEPNPVICWYDSLTIQMKGNPAKMQGENWQWISPDYALNCTDCLNPGLRFDTTQSKLIFRQIRGNCQVEDTISLLGKMWVKPQVIYQGDTYSVVQPEGNYIYRWWQDSQLLAEGTGVQNTSGSLKLEILAPNGCGNRYFIPELLATPTQALPFMENQMALFPNPTSGEFVIQPSHNETYRFKLYDASLKLIDKGAQSGTYLYQKALKSGTYYLSIELKDGTSTSQRLVVR